MVLAFVTFGLRLYVRIGSTWGSEDTVMAIAAVSTLVRGATTNKHTHMSHNYFILQVPFAVLSISCILGSVNGIGAHAATLAQPGNEKYETLGLMYFFLFEIFYCATIIPIKLSIALMLIRIARNRKAYVWSQWAMMSLFFIADGGAFFYIVFQCTPVSYVRGLVLFSSLFISLEENMVLTRTKDMLGTPPRTDSVCQQPIWPTFTIPVPQLTSPRTGSLLSCKPTVPKYPFESGDIWLTLPTRPIPLLWNVKLERSEKLSVGAILGLGVL